MKPRVFCRDCGDLTDWRPLGRELGEGPPVYYWRCVGCELVRLSLGGRADGIPAKGEITDADGLCMAVLDARMRGTGPGDGRLDRDDLLGHLRVELWSAYRDWDGRGTCLGYCTWKLRNACADWYRSWLGRDLPKPLAISESLDVVEDEDFDMYSGLASDESGGRPRLDDALTHRAMDREPDRNTDLGRLLDKRNSDLAGQDVRMGVRPAA